MTAKEPRGRGRPPVDPKFRKNHIPAPRLPQWMIDELAKLPNQSQAIEDALIKAYGWEAPE